MDLIMNFIEHLPQSYKPIPDGENCGHSYTHKLIIFIKNSNF